MELGVAALPDRPFAWCSVKDLALAPAESNSAPAMRHPVWRSGTWFVLRSLPLEKSGIPHLEDWHHRSRLSGNESQQHQAFPGASTRQGKGIAFYPVLKCARILKIMERFFVGLAVLCTAVYTAYGESDVFVAKESQQSEPLAQYIFQPRWECDIQLRIQHPIAHNVFDVMAHGEFKKMTFETYQDIPNIILVRPDLKKRINCIHYSCEEGQLFDEIEWLDEYFITSKFMYRDEAEWNGQKCYKYYNDQTQYHVYADEANTLLAIYLGDKGYVNFTDYKFDPVPATEFVIPVDGSGSNVADAYSPPREYLFDTIKCPDHSGTTMNGITMWCLAVMLVALLLR